MEVPFMAGQRKFGIAPSGNETHDLLLKVGGTIIMGNLTTLTKGHRGSRLQCLREASGLDILMALFSWQKQKHIFSVQVMTDNELESQGFN